MNPEINLKTFSGDPHHSTGSSPSKLVSPPKRFISRVVLPVCLISCFIAVFLYTLKDSLRPIHSVTVIQPAYPIGNTLTLEDSGTTDNSSEKTSPGTPIFQSPGWIEPAPFPTTISAFQQGILTSIYVLEGDEIRPGEILAELDSKDAVLNLRKAQALIQLRNAELDEAMQTWDNPTELVQNLKEAQAEKRKLEAEKAKLSYQYKYQKKFSDISSTLGSAGVESRIDAEKNFVDAKVLEASLLELDAKIDQQNAIIEGAETNYQLRISDKSNLALAKARLAEAENILAEKQLALDRCQIISSTTGTIMKVLKNPGEILSFDIENGLQIFTVYNPESLQVRAEIPLSDAAKIQLGLPAVIMAEALPDKHFDGEIIRVVHQADIQRNSLQVKVAIRSPTHVLKPEMTVRVQFFSPRKLGKNYNKDDNKESQADTGNVTNLLIPENLVHNPQGDKAQIWIVKNGTQAVLRDITLGVKSDKGMRIVTSGLQPTDKVISSKTDKLTLGARVQIVETNHEENLHEQ